MATPVPWPFPLTLTLLCLRPLAGDAVTLCRAACACVSLRTACDDATFWPEILLDSHRRSLDDAALATLLARTRGRLLELDLAGCTRLSKRALLAALTTQPALQFFALDGVTPREAATAALGRACGGMRAAVEALRKEVSRPPAGGDAAACARAARAALFAASALVHSQGEDWLVEPADPSPILLRALAAHATHAPLAAACCRLLAFTWDAIEPDALEGAIAAVRGPSFVPFPHALLFCI